MKKCIAALLCALLFISCCAALAEDKPLAGKTLTVALSPNFMYFETVSDTDPTGYEGLDIDVIKRLSEELGFDFKIEPMDFSSLIGALQTGNADFVISGMSYSDERAQAVDFSITYATTDVGCITLIDSDINSVEDLAGKTVCCSQGTTYEGLIEAMENVTKVTYNGQAAVGQAVAQGSDGVAAGLTSVNGSKKLSNELLDAEGNPLLRYFVLEGDVADQYNIAFPKGSELVPLFDSAIQSMIDSGELGEMIKSWLY